MNRLTCIRLLAVGVCVLILELVCRAGLITPYTLIPPSQMLAGLIEMLWSGKLDADMLRTLLGKQRCELVMRHGLDRAVEHENVLTANGARHGAFTVFAQRSGQPSP